MERHILVLRHHEQSFELVQFEKTNQVEHSQQEYNFPFPSFDEVDDSSIVEGIKSEFEPLEELDFFVLHVFLGNVVVFGHTTGI